mgnify:CR=1 FL=1
MPVCKYCNARISNHDRDLCPVCGGLRPLDGAPSSETIEFTQGIDITDDSVRGQTPRTKNNTMLLFILIGWTGLGFNYLRYKISKVLILKNDLLFSNHIEVISYTFIVFIKK